MNCPFANVSFQGSNEVTESQKVSYKIYDMEAEILKTTKHLEKLREARRRLEVEDEMKRLGTVENVEKEFNKIYGEGAARGRPNRQLTCLKALLSGIVYTLKDFDNRLKQDKIHVHAENMPLKFTKLPEECLSRPRSAPESRPPPPPPCEGDCPDEMDKIWAANSTEFEIGDERLVAEVLNGFIEAQPAVDRRIEFDPTDGTTYCSDKPDDSFTFSTKVD